MKILLLLASLCLLQAAWTYPASNECPEYFSQEICDEYDVAASPIDGTDDESRVQRQLPPDGDLLEGLIKEKLQFLISIGLFKNIPFLGEAIHKLVEQDPEGVAKALKGGFFGALRLVQMVLGAAALG